MIKVQVSNQNMVDCRKQFETAGLEESFSHAGPGVNHYLVLAGFDENGRSVTFK